jgi:hypothetical protein
MPVPTVQVQNCADERWEAGMSCDNKDKVSRIIRWGIVGLPLTAAIAASFFPLRVIYQQALIGIVLIWFQFSLMLGVFTNG